MRAAHATTTVVVDATGVAALTLSMDAGNCPLDSTHPVTVVINGERLAAAPVHSDRSWVSHFRSDGGAAVAITPLLHGRYWRQDDLVLRGLAVLANARAPDRIKSARA